MIGSWLLICTTISTYLIWEDFFSNHISIRLVILAIYNYIVRSTLYGFSQAFCSLCFLRIKKKIFFIFFFINNPSLHLFISISSYIRIAKSIRKHYWRMLVEFVGAQWPLNFRTFWKIRPTVNHFTIFLIEFQIHTTGCSVGVSKNEPN